MRALFNNYEMDSTVNEYVSPLERQEENEFIDELLKTPVMKAAMKFLQDKGNIRLITSTKLDVLFHLFWFISSSYRCCNSRSKNAIWLAEDHLVQFILTRTGQNR